MRIISCLESCEGTDNPLLAHNIQGPPPRPPRLPMSLVNREVKQEEGEVPDTWWRNFPPESQLYPAPSSEYIQRYQELVAQNIKREFRSRWNKCSVAVMLNLFPFQYSSRSNLNLNFNLNHDWCPESKHEVSNLVIVRKEKQDKSTTIRNKSIKVQQRQERNQSSLESKLINIFLSQVFVCTLMQHFS